MGMFLNFVQYNENGKRDSSGMCVPQTGEVTLPSPAVAHNSLMVYFN